MRNGAARRQVLADLRAIRRYEMHANIGECRSGYQMRPLEMWMVLGIKGNGKDGI